MSGRYLIVLLVLALLVSGCDGFNSIKSDPKTTDYYTGTEGVRMRFVPGSPPSRMFYYSNQPDNAFEVAVELKNVGSSDAIGATYISGFSPDFAYIEGTNIQPTGIDDCIFDINLFSLPQGSSDIGFYFSCNGIEVTQNGADNWNIRLGDVGSFFGISDSIINSILVNNNNGHWGLHIGWDAFGSIDILNHGRALSLLLSAIDFTRYNGYPFNGGQEKQGPGILRGDNYLYPGGDYGYQNYIGHFTNTWPAGVDEVDLKFLVTSCYGYVTYAAPKICVDPAPYDETEKVCTPHDYTWSGSQGAPVAITSLQQESTPDRVFITFRIRNVGRGTVIHPGYLERCSPYFPGKLDERFKNTVFLGDVRIGDQRLTCSPSYAVRLSQNEEASVTCEYPIMYATAKSGYETPVVIELWYGYQESMQTSMHVKRVV